MVMSDFNPKNSQIYLKWVLGVSSIDQAVIDLVKGVSIWGVPGLVVDSFVHEERIFYRHLPACGKVDHSEAIFICTLMQAVLAFRWLMYDQLLRSRLPSPTSRHDLGRLRMPAPAVHKIDPWPSLLSHLLVHVC
jgi:hypothetical protein